MAWKKVPMDAPTESIPEAPPVKAPEVDAPEPERAFLSPKSTSGTMLRHGAQGPTFGFADELGGAVMAAGAGGADLVTRGLAAAGVPPFNKLNEPGMEEALANAHDFARRPKESFGAFLARQYRGNRDEQRAEDDAAREANPKTALASSIGGGLLVPVPGAGLAKGASLGARMGRGIKTGAGVGATSGLGNSKADLTKGDAAEAAFDTGFGGALGGGIGALIPAGGAAVGGVVPWLKKTAETQAFKALTGGGRIVNQAKQVGLDAIDDILGDVPASLEGSVVQTPEQLGRFVLDRNALKLSPVETVRTLRQLLAGEKGQATDALRKASSTGAMDMTQAAAEQRAAASGLNEFEKLAAGPRESMVGALERTAQKTPKLDFEAANALKTTMNAGFKPGLENKPSQQSLNDAIRLYRQQILKQVEREAGPDVSEALSAANNNQANLIMAEKLSADRALRGMANQSGGLIGTLMGSGGLNAGAALGGPAGAAVGALGGYGANALRSYAPAAIAKALDSASKKAQPIQPLLSAAGRGVESMTPTATRFLEYLRRRKQGQE